MVCDLDQEGKRGPNPALWWVNEQGDEVKWSFREATDLTCHAANVFTQTCSLHQGDRTALILPRVPEWWLVALGCIQTGQSLRENFRDLRNVTEPIGLGILGAFSSPAFFLLHSLFLRLLQIFFTPSHTHICSNAMS